MGRQLDQALDAVTLGPARRRRRMRKLLSALDRLDGTPACGPRPVSRDHQRPAGHITPVLAGPGPRDWTPTPGPVPTASPRPRRTGGRNLAVGMAVMAACMLGGPVLIGALPGWLAPTEATGPTAHTDAVTPLGGPPPAPAGEGGYSFVQTQDTGEPVTWDPCRSITYVVAGTAPTGAESAVAAAVADLSAATGLTFIDGGSTLERVTTTVREPFQPDRYGDRWVPLLIDWTSPQLDPGLAGDVAGLGGGQAVTDAGWSTYVTGQITLDTPQVAEMIASFAAAGDPRGPAAAQALVTHELAHALGLDHVDDAGQLMHPTALTLTLGDGDRRGLAALGAGRCAPQL